MTMISEDTYLCLKLVARYADIISQQRINTVITHHHGTPFELTFHNDPWDLHHVTKETLEEVLCLVGAVDIPPSQLTTLYDPDGFYAMLFGDMAKSRNVVAAAYALKHCDRLCGYAMLLTIMQVIGHEAVATGDTALFETLFVPSTYLNKLANSEWHDDIYDLLADLMEEAAFRGYPDMFRVLDTLDIQDVITFTRHPHDGYYDLQFVHHGVVEECFYFHSIDALKFAMALVGGDELMIDYAMNHSEPAMRNQAQILEKLIYIPHPCQLPPEPIPMNYSDDENDV